MTRTTKQRLLGGIAALILLGAAMPGAIAADDHGHAHEEEGSHGDEHAEGSIELSADQIKAADIQVMVAGPGELAKEISVPGNITAAADRMAQVVPKASGTVYEARKNIGDTVKKGDVLALIESREMAEAVAEYQAAGRAADLSRATFKREQSLWDKKITAEQDYLMAKNAHQEAGIRLDLAKQKLQALGHDGKIAASNTRFHELKAPLDGRVIARELTLGEYVDTSHTAFTIADLGTMWVETAIPSGDIAFLKEGQIATIAGNGHTGTGTLTFISPAIDADTRAAKAIITLPNPDGLWRAGDFATAAIATSAQAVPLAVLKDALTSIDGKPALFVKTDHGFEKRDVITGREDSRMVEITAGLKNAEQVAVSNVFTLKAELGKSEAEHTH